MCPLGRVRPHTYTTLMIHQPRLGLRAFCSPILVLDDNAGCRDVDIFIGQPFLDLYFGGQLPQAYQNADDVAVIASYDPWDGFTVAPPGSDSEA